VAPDRVEDLGLELAKVRRIDPDPGPALKAHETEKRDMNGAQPNIRGFVRGKCWLAGRAAKAVGTFGDAPTPRSAAFAAEGLRLLKSRVEAQCTASRSAVPPQAVMVDSPCAGRVSPSEWNYPG
jgi:hypothetical protein